MAISTLEAPAHRHSDARAISSCRHSSRWSGGENKPLLPCPRTSFEGAGGGGGRKRTRAGTDPDHPYDEWGLTERLVRSCAPTGGWKLPA
jgi:hypothetical protein